MWSASTHLTEYSLVSFTIITLILAHTRVASTKRVTSGASFKLSKKRVLQSTRWLNFEQLLKLTVSLIADMTFISVLNDHTFYIHFAFAIIFKKNLHMDG